VYKLYVAGLFSSGLVAILGVRFTYKITLLSSRARAFSFLIITKLYIGLLCFFAAHLFGSSGTHWYTVRS